ncbi:hypothetical protein [Methylophilus sp. 3sh_L]|uniref:hypothetical protein n=1 Tax=Methylophilus sp. 3sh_L TaxID=3377114 RepID=UPI00398E8EFF
MANHLPKNITSPATDWQRLSLSVSLTNPTDALTFKIQFEEIKHKNPLIHIFQSVTNQKKQAGTPVALGLANTVEKAVT